MKRKHLLVLFPLLLAAVSANANDQATFQEAEQHLASGDYRLALDRYSYLVNRYPESAYIPTAQFRLGQVNFYLGRYPEALARLERVAVRYVEFQDRVPFWLGLTNYRLGDYEGAVGNFDRAVDVDDTDGTTYLYRGLSHRHLGNLDSAIEDLEKARRRGTPQEKGYAVAYLLELYVRTETYDTAVQLWQEVSDDLDEDDGFQSMRVRFAADAAYQSDNRELAEKLYRLLTDYTIADAHWAFARLYRIAQAQGQSDKALQVFRDAERRLGAEPQRLAEFWLDLGIDAYRREQYELSVVYLQRLWDIRDERPIEGSTVELLAGALDKAGRRDQAISILSESLQELSDANHQLRMLLAELFLTDGRDQEARELLEEVGQAIPQTERYRYLLALARHRTGADEAAVTLLEDERYSPIRAEQRTARLRSLLLLRTNQPVEAVRSYREYVTAHPVDGETQLRFVQALLAASEILPAEQTLSNVDADSLRPEQQARFSYLSGIVDFEQGRYDRAVASFSRALDMMKSLETRDSRLVALEDVQYYLGWAAYRSGSAADALAALQGMDMDRIRPDLRFDAQYLEAWVLYQLQDYDQAVSLLKGLLETAGDVVQERRLRSLAANAYVASGRTESAREEYRRLIALGGPDEVVSQTWENFAELLATDGRVDDALAAYANLHDQYPDTDAGRRALIERGLLLYREQNQMEPALDVFRSYLDAYPDGPEYPDALYWAGRSAVEAGRSQAALLWWEPLAEDYPDHQYAPQVLAESARLYKDAGRIREALDVLERLVARYPQAVDIAESRLLRDQLRLQQLGLTEREANLLAQLQASDSPDTGSSRWFELVLELGKITVREQVAFTPLRASVIDYLIQAASVEQPKAAEAALLLAEYYQSRGERAAAIENYSLAIQTSGASSAIVGQASFQLMQLYARAGQVEQARQVLEALRSVNGTEEWVQRGRQLLEEMD